MTTTSMLTTSELSAGVTQKVTHPLRMFLISPDLGRILTTEVFSLGADQLRDHGGFRTDDAGHGRQSRLNGDRFIA